MHENIVIFIAKAHKGHELRDVIFAMVNLYFQSYEAYTYIDNLWGHKNGYEFLVLSPKIVVAAYCLCTLYEVWYRVICEERDLD